MRQKKLLVLVIVAILSITYPGFALVSAVHAPVSHGGTGADKPTQYIYDASPVRSSAAC